MSPPLLLLLLLFIISPSSMASSSATISLPLLRHLPSSSSSSSSSSSPLLLLSSASLRRASHLKSPKPPPYSSSVALFPHSYGGYSLPVSFGSPPQPLPLLLDSASPLSWLPCTHSYRCLRCGSTSSPVPTFLPKSSSSSRLISCSNPSCLWIHPPRLLDSACRNTSSHAAKPHVCPPYLILYGTGSTAGLLLAETLALPSRSVPGFVVGCSVFSDRQPPTGLAAFGRGAPSFPAQLGLKRFSYCLLSRRFDDDAAVSGSLILGGGGGDDDGGGLSFVPLLPNPSPFPAYYYVGLRRITVGRRRVRLPRRALVPDPGGSGGGGAIVDSGTTFTYLHPAAFAPLAAALLDSVAGRLNRSASAERRTGLRPCFALPPSPPRGPEAAAELGLPELALHFNGSAEMRLPVENCFVLAGPVAAAEAVCLAVVSGDDGGGGGGEAGPWIILGSFQQQNYYMVYDLEKDRLGFRPQSCSGV